MPTAMALSCAPSLTLLRTAALTPIKRLRGMYVTSFPYTSLIEPLSLDEARLDVTDMHCYGSATLIARGDSPSDYFQ
ncbi:hypothetical protein KCP70_17655 [Salmonella enterica subsp. enterica]|nr:hypothetical protein KCP70_17655 [Salmonella enterica subsp. enterica]